MVNMTEEDLKTILAAFSSDTRLSMITELERAAKDTHGEHQTTSEAPLKANLWSETNLLKTALKLARDVQLEWLRINATSDTL